MKPRKMTPNFDYDAFIKAWRSSSSAVEAARKVGIPAMDASRRAALLRKNGVEMKRMQPGRPRSVNWKKLSKEK